jgi:hypothetical protein
MVTAPCIGEAVSVAVVWADGWPWGTGHFISFDMGGS